MMIYEIAVNIWQIVIPGIFGIIVGSFLNVCIYRIPLRFSVISGNKGRSMCTSCGHDLQWYDLLPVISYIFLGGKCRYCKRHISKRYPIVECLNSLLWILAANVYGVNLQAFCYSIFFSILVVVAFIDWDIQEIPYRLEASIGAVALASLFIPGFPGWKERFIGMLIISVPMALGAFLNAFGGGDVQLVFISGFFLGWRPMVIAAFLAVFTGALHAMTVMIKGKRREHIPFGPYLAAGMIVASLYGTQIFDWYVGFF